MDIPAASTPPFSNALHDWRDNGILYGTRYDYSTPCPGYRGWNVSHVLLRQGIWRSEAWTSIWRMLASALTRGSAPALHMRLSSILAHPHGCFYIASSISALMPVILLWIGQARVMIWLYTFGWWVQRHHPPVVENSELIVPSSTPVVSPSWR